ncbi:MAG TPA: amylo-alpha-1,6-glucosidase [Candidatus Cybelea sp.]|nr:amylo-alpha-1,6-glucosidase [Candidatus Cybelea sp.]
MGDHAESYEISDTEMAAGSTFGGPKCVCTVKATGAIEKVYSSDCGKTLIGTVVTHHWDRRTGIALTSLPGSFVIHPAHQEHRFALSNGVNVKEIIFVLSGKPDGDDVDPPAVYYEVELYNPTAVAVAIESYGFAMLRGETGHDVRTAFDKRHNALVAFNKSDEAIVRAFACSSPVTSWEVTMNHGKAIAKDWPGILNNDAPPQASDPLGVLHLSHELKPKGRARFCFTITFSTSGKREMLRALKALPTATEALRSTQNYYDEILNRSVVLTPDTQVNRGVFWAKANMLRTMLFAPTGWCFVNDPTRSNNSVARDTAWFAFGADYIVPEFARESLLWYAEHLERRGMVVEYYDVRNGKSEDYGLNINDNTPLLILALWHHYNTTQNFAFLKRVYPAARKAATYLLSQRNAQGLVWCTAKGTADWGIVGWRNVIKDYRLAGATTEVNSECYAAIQTVSRMARVLGKHEESRRFKSEAEALRNAINTHLLNEETALYYLNIDADGVPHSDVTADLVFPVMFGVADAETAAGIISRLSAEEFWTEAGIRTVPRNAVDYGPVHGNGLLGGVWAGAAFWYAFAAAKFNPSSMAESLSQAFAHYSKDPRRNNTVPGQFSEWLHGETLVNQGMMLSPWFPPRYLWAAIEGAAGLDLSDSSPTIEPRLAPDWKWLGVRDVPLGEVRLSWFAVRVPELRLYTNYHFAQSTEYLAYDTDISHKLTIGGGAAVALAFRRGEECVLFVGNTADRTITTAISAREHFTGSYAVRHFSSLRGEWTEDGTVSADELKTGIPVQIERKGFSVFELRQVA